MVEDHKRQMAALGSRQLLCCFLFQGETALSSVLEQIKTTGTLNIAGRTDCALEAADWSYSWHTADDFKRFADALITDPRSAEMVMALQFAPSLANDAEIWFVMAVLAARFPHAVAPNSRLPMGVFPWLGFAPIDVGKHSNTPVWASSLLAEHQRRTEAKSPTPTAAAASPIRPTASGLLPSSARLVQRVQAMLAKPRAPSTIVTTSPAPVHVSTAVAPSPGASELDRLRSHVDELD